VYPAIDVSLPHWTELPPIAMKPSQPVIADNVCWTADDFLPQAAGRRTRRLTTLEHMLRKARATLDRAARHPSVLGYVWGRWQDEPGEQPPFAGGLVHVNGAEAREHTELLAQLNSSRREPPSLSDWRALMWFAVAASAAHGPRFAPASKREHRRRGGFQPPKTGAQIVLRRLRNRRSDGAKGGIAATGLWAKRRASVLVPKHHPLAKKR
jgi:hypothetical protein